ncbi:MAG: hypothetical protein R3F61_10680 [Myxococcota bacterium]
MRAGCPLVLTGLLAIAGCSGAEPSDSDLPNGCEALVVSDIDETLTTSDGELIAQLLDAAYDQAMRPDANTAMSRWADAGYRVLYVTARGEQITLTDDRTMRQATSDWLDLHGFPRSEGDLFLSPGVAAAGEEARAYKASVLLDAQAAGDVVVAAYGNADTDLEAYVDAGLTPEQVYVVGERAGDPRGVPVPDEEAYTGHLATLSPPPASCP